MPIRQTIALPALTLAAALAAAPAPAQEWEWDFALYLFGTGLEGTTGVGPVTADVDLSFSDLLDNLDFGAMTFVRASRGDWSVMVDTIYTDLGARGQRARVDVTQLILEVDVAYRFSEAFELFAGARLVDVDSRIDLLLPLNPTGVSAGAGESWVDPVIGLRLEAPLADRWTFFGRVSAGGFGVGSDASYHLALNLGYRVGARSELVLGWRHLDIDYDDGAGRDRFLYDVALSGPQLGYLFRF